MTHDNTNTLDPSREYKSFRVTLRPYRSLGPKGFLVLMAALSSISFISGMYFVIQGAWPVMGFFGLEVLIVYLAFKINYRSGALFEVIDLSQGNLNLTRVHPSGKAESFDFDPYWVRIRLDEGKDGRNDLVLYHHAREVSFAKFFNEDERREFAELLRNALIDVRGGVRI